MVHASQTLYPWERVQTKRELEALKKDGGGLPLSGT